MNSIRTSYGDSSKIEGGQIVLSTGAICLDGNAKPYLNAPIDAEGNRIYIMERAGKGQAVNSKLSGTDGLTVASWSQSSSTSSGGTGVSIGSAESDYTGDTYIYSRIDTPVDFLPRGVERPGNLYLYGYWQCGNYNINMNALFGTGAMRLSNGFTITTTLGHDGSDGNFEGRFIRENGTWSITKIGTGCQRFGGDCSHNGKTTIEQGTLQFDGSVTQSKITVKDGACLAGVGSIAKDANLENNTVLYPGSVYLADDKTLDFASKLTFGESATLRLKVYSKSTVSSVDVAGAFSAAGDVTVELDKDTFRGEACILKSSEPLQANFVRGLNCGHLQLRNDSTELWMRGNTALSIFVR
jgi:autotransporter-associated beta strand protein